MKNIKTSKILIRLAILTAIIGIIIPFFMHYMNFSTSEKENILSWVGSFSMPFLTFSTILILIGTMCSQKEETKFQKFENTFFKLINYNHEIVNSIDIKGEFSGERKGRQYFMKTYYNFKSFCDKKIGGMGYEFIIDSKGYLDMKEQIIKVYEEFFDMEDGNLGHYFRNLYHIFKFIDKQTILDEEEKLYYASLVRAQLSAYELLLLFYNVLSKHGVSKFKPLVDKYDVLQNMNPNKLIHIKHFEIYKRYAK